MMRNFMLTGATVATVLLLSACGGAHSTPTSSMNHGDPVPSAAASATGSFNDVDVAFVQAMIPHHQQAVQMAALADGRVADGEVKSLAGKIQAAQQPEIDTMTTWLTAWGRPASMPSMSVEAHESMGHGSMPGMMSDADMTKLMAAKGAAFDKQFVTMMIAHHEGAVTMAREEVAKGSNPDATALAKKIITDQQAEITTMESILRRL
ncbi:DUF305 domain-containing protein [Actinoplanes regularis]|uniref:Uncharacterized conserved protein, DUF305 family n=1 Tax=Actinoplanes regularis TaxID=52697 RepID=A0A239JWW1_9ACTN|nr:DUF305 domain-containing protein [Actinoplanes regularis]GIE92238.1 hypothetical protein Are01nite_87180 [Actinoplanes regularis]SNT10437.1 Uncharacterized conserved protein, DUF305 family [Actinoplanes regularis]